MKITIPDGHTVVTSEMRYGFVGEHGEIPSSELANLLVRDAESLRVVPNALLDKWTALDTRHSSEQEAMRRSVEQCARPFVAVAIATCPPDKVLFIRDGSVVGQIIGVG